MTSRKPGMDSRGSRENRIGFVLIGTREPGRRRPVPEKRRRLGCDSPQIRKSLENSPESPEQTRKQAM